MVADLMLYVFNPENQTGTFRWDGFFKKSTNAPTLPDYWMTGTPKGFSNSTQTQTSYPSFVGSAEMRYENAMLFMRGCLITREFHDAVKTDDSSRIFMVLKVCMGLEFP